MIINLIGLILCSITQYIQFADLFREKNTDGVRNQRLLLSLAGLFVLMEYVMQIKTAGPPMYFLMLANIAGFFLYDGLSLFRRKK